MGSVFSNKRRIILGLYIAFVALVLVPVWWYLTDTSRTTLPHQDIAEQVNLQGIHTPAHQLPISVRVAVVGSSDNAAAGIVVKEMNSKFAHSHNLKFILRDADGLDASVVRELINSQQGKDEVDEYIHSRWEEAKQKRGVFSLFVWEGDKSNTEQALFFGKYRNVFAQLQHLDEDSLRGVLESVAHVLTQNVATKQDYLRFASSFKYRLSFTLLNEDPKSHLVDWDFEMLAQDFLYPALERLSAVADFSVDSQIMHYGNLPKKPQFNKKFQSYDLYVDDLKNILIENDWKFESSAHSEPNMQFLLYIPSSKYSPTRVILTKNQQQPIVTNGFVIPQWGGIVLHNLSGGSETQQQIVLNSQNMRTSMQVFLAQLRSLIGMPSVSCAPNTRNFKCEAIFDERYGVSEWEVDVLTRQRANEMLVKAVSNLGKLSKLILEMANVFALPSLHTHATSSLYHLSQARKYCSEGNFSETIYHVQQAYTESHAAIFDPTMLSLLYFPDDHKLAIYLPLVLPVIITLVSALRKEFRAAKQKRQAITTQK